MAIQFPDPSQSPYTNPETGEVYIWNTTSGGWRRQAAVDAGQLPSPDTPTVQPGTYDDRYVNIIGDKMTGPLIQNLAAKTNPDGTGNLTTNAPADTRLEFRYQGSDDVVRCVTLPLGCCQTVLQRTHIEVQGGGSGYAEVGAVLEITENAEILPTAAIDETQWQIETAAGSRQFEDIPGETGTTYTVVAGDLGKLIRVRQVFLQGEECEKTVYSNVIAVAAVAPVVNYVGVTFDSDTLKMEMTLTNDAEVYREDNGNWVLETTLNAGTGVQYQTSTPGFYIVESDNMTKLRFSYSSGDSAKRSIGLTLDERSYMGAIVDAAHMFYQHEDFNQDLTWWNTSNVTTMWSMFAQCTSFNGDISNWDVSNVTSMENMFFEAENFNSDISLWNTSSLVAFENAFAHATAFNQPIGNWSMGGVTSLFGVFTACVDFNQDLDLWDVSNVENMEFTFFGAESFNKDLNSWNVEKVTSMKSMFKGAKYFKGDISSWNTLELTNMQQMFSGANFFNQDVSNWDVSKVTDMAYTFSDAWNFISDISGWDVSSVEDMQFMFNYALGFNQDLSGWDVSSVNNMTAMFKNSLFFDQDISSWCVPLIAQRPTNFSANANDNWKDDYSRQPQWGLCPPKVLTNPIIA